MEGPLKIHQPERDRPQRLIVEVDQRPHEIVEDPNEVDDADGCEGGAGQRKHDAHENPELRRAVDAGRLRELSGNTGEIGAEKEDGKRHPGEIGQDHREVRVDQAKRPHDLEGRHHDHLRRNHHAGEEIEEERFLAAKVEMRQRMNSTRWRPAY